MDNIFEDFEEDSDFEEEIEDCSVFWSPPPTPPPYELPGYARQIANFHGFTLEELEAMRPDEIRQLQKEWFRDRIRRLHRRIMELEAQRDRFVAAVEEEGERSKEKFYSIPGTCRSKDPQNRIRKNLHNLMYFYSTFPIMM
ncbi:unnamed protein product [Caenorhabditis brenneri]